MRIPFVCDIEIAAKFNVVPNCVSSCAARKIVRLQHLKEAIVAVMLYGHVFCDTFAHSIHGVRVCPCNVWARMRYNEILTDDLILVFLYMSTLQRPLRNNLLFYG